MKTKNTLSYILIFFALLPTLIVALVLVVLFNARANTLIDDNITSTSYWQANNINDLFLETQQSLLSLSKRVSAERILLTNNEQGLADMVDRALPVMDKWLAEHNYAIRVSVVDAENKVLVSTNKKHVGQSAELENIYISMLKKGKRVTSSIHQDIYENNENSFVIAQPIFCEEEYVGFVMMDTRLDLIEQRVAKLGFFETGAIIVADADNIIVATNSIYDMQRSEYISLNSQILREGKKDGSFRFKYLNDSRIISYNNISAANWKFISYVNPAQFSVSVELIVAIAIALIVIFCAIMFIMRSMLIKNFSSPLEKLLLFMHEMNEGDYATRIPNLGKNEFSDIATAFNLLMARIQDDNQELAIKEERYRIASEQSNSIIFEFNVIDNSLTCSKNAIELAGYPLFENGFPQSFVEQGLIHENDKADYLKLAYEMMNGCRQGCMELRVKTKLGAYHWFELALTTIIDSSTFKPLRVIGKMTDIDEEKRHKDNLEFKAERDLLTSVLNKATTQAVIAKRLEERSEEQLCALLVLDIDCFKLVNDGYGHQMGDTVLVELANTLVEQVRGNDVVGRMGGDEFMVLLTDMPSLEAVKKKAEALLCAVRNIMIDKEKGIHITSSMGIAVTQKSGTSFTQLYAEADKALYECKHKGKDGFAFCKNIG